MMAGAISPAGATGNDTCGYNPLAAPKPGGGTVIFDENSVTRAAQFYGTGLAGHLGVFANDESSLFLGAGSTAFKSAGATTLAQTLTQNVQYGPTGGSYPLQVAATSAPFAVNDPIVLKNASGTQNLKVFAAAAKGATSISVFSFKAGKTFSPGDSATDTNIPYGEAVPPTLAASSDAQGRPIYPAIYLTDLTAAAQNNTPTNAGDWEQGGLAANGGPPPFADAIYGTWTNVSGTKPAVKNNWNLGPDADAIPATDALGGVTTSFNEGYGTEVVWNASGLKVSGTASLQTGHQYRAQMITHDGDQNHTSNGGDVGEVCTTFTVPGPPGLKTDPTGQTSDGNASTVDAKIKEPIGSTINDSAFLSKNPGFDNVTGKVTFNLFFWAAGTEPTDSSTACVSAHNTGFSETKDLTVGDPSTASTSPGYDTSQNGLGTYYWRASYDPNGDPNYTATSETCGTEQDQMVDARIRLSPHEATNVVGNAHVLTATIDSTTDGTHFSAVSGAAVTGSFVGTTHAFFVPANTAGNNACTTGAAGTCTLTINDNSVETVTVHATSTFTTAGLRDGDSFTRSTTSTGSCSDTNTNSTCDAIKHYINPKTQLTVSDRLTGLGTDATGSVTYTAWVDDNTCAAAADGGSPQDLTPTNHSIGANGVAPLSTTITVDPGHTVYFEAHYVGNEGEIITQCTAESAQSQ
jgi:hypothetical protein